MNAASKYIFRNMMCDRTFALFCKTIAVIDSCKTTNQIMVAVKYNRLATIKAGFPWYIHGYIVTKINEIKKKQGGHDV